MDKKKLLTVGVGIVAVVGLALFVFLRGPSENKETSTKDEGFFSFLFPSSENKEGAPYAGPTEQLDDGEYNVGDYSTPGKLIQLTRKAVSGATFNEEDLKINYFEKPTGHLYEIDSFGKNEVQKTITTIPKIFEVSFSADSSRAVFRYLAESEEESVIEPVYTFSATSLESQEVEGIFLPMNTAVAVSSPKEDKIFYLLVGDTSAGLISDFENKNKKEIFYSPFSEFLADWPAEKTITLLTKPSSLVEGYFYRLNPGTGSFTKIIGNIKGLTALYSPHGNRVIYSQSEGSGLSTKIYDIDTGVSSDFNYKTMPEKCLWSPANKDIIYCAVPVEIPSGHYPDDWYKGNVQFADKLWKINLADGSTETILEGGDFDMVSLFSNSTEDFVFFQNKKDGTLWSLKLTTGD